ncbi:MAG TPA: DMT family transporter [Clostridiaceae bacterium]|mgnify:CR=1 FL=1|nr:DMT family transporter [Clostridiaceae bacterium]
MEKKKQVEITKARFWTKPVVWLTATIICVILWGSAFPIVKTGYKLFRIDNSSPDAIPSMILFGGTRFFITGILMILFTVITEKINPFPQNKVQWRDSFILALPVTIFQYGFYFIGIANTSGAVGSIMASTSSFMEVILAGFIFADEKLNLSKIIGCCVGFIGVIILNVSGDTVVAFNWLGDGLILLSALSTSIGTNVNKVFVKRNHPRLLSGWNFILGSSVLLIIGLSFGGSLNPVNAMAWLLLLYLSSLSAIAFALWTTMLKYHPVAKLSVFKTLIPVTGTIGSAIILKENILQTQLIVALIVVMLGIYLVNRNK